MSWSTPASASAAPSADMEHSIPMSWGTAPGIASDIAADRLQAAIAAAAATQGGAIAKFYAARDNAPLWTGAAGWTARGRAARTRIADAAADGLDPGDFPLPPATLSEHTPEAIARAEIALSAAAVAFAREAEGGRIDPNRLGANIEEHPPRPAPAEVLAKLAGNGDVAALLSSYNPPAPQFQALRRKLAELRREAADNAPPKVVPVVPPGPTLRPGMRSPRVAVLRARLGVTALDTDPEVYDDEVSQAVRGFQQDHSLSPDGLVGRNTLAILNAAATTTDPIPTIVANMERWRWLPRDLGTTHVMVNVPEFMVRIVRAGKVVHQAEVIVGKTNHQTPIFSNAIQFMVVNPYWHVPKSIATNEIVPHLLRDPNYLARENLQVLYRGRPIDPWSVDWRRANLSQVHFRQAPGADNALGRIKFLFPNKFSVYLHDTNQKRLFQRPVRAFSHGCVRVQDPFAFAAALTPDTGIPLARIKTLVGGGERWLKLPRKIPIYIVYFTASVDAGGNLVTRRDIYGYDRIMTRLLSSKAELASARH